MALAIKDVFMIGNFACCFGSDTVPESGEQSSPSEVRLPLKGSRSVVDLPVLLFRGHPHTFTNLAL